MADYTVKLTLTADGKVLVKTLGEAEKGLDQVGAKARKTGAEAKGGMEVAASGVVSLKSEVRELTSTVTKLVGAFATVAWLNQFAGKITDASNAMAGFTRGLAAATGSQAAAAYAMAFVRDEAQRLGTDLRSSAQAYTALAAAARGTTLEGEGARKIFSAVSEASRVLNLSTDATAGALNAIQQMMSKGNVSAEELRGQLGERLPGAFSLAAQAMGVTTQQLNKMLDDGQVLATDLLPKLADQLHAVYGAGATGAANDPAASFARLKNAAFEFLAALGDAGVMDTLAVGARVLASALQALTPILPVLTGAVATLAAVIGVNYVASTAKAAIATAATNAALVELAAMNLRVAQTAEAEAVAELAKARALELGGVAAGRAAVAEGALAAAQLRTAEAAAASSAASVAGAGALSRLGSGALALVGGPIGALVIALGALAAAIYSVVKAEEERIAQFNDGIQSIEQATDATIGLANARAALAASAPETLGDVARQEATNLELLASKQAEYNQKRAELEAIEEKLGSVRMRAAELFGTASLMERAAIENAGTIARDELAALGRAMDDLRGATNDLTADMRTRFAAFLANDLPAAARDAEIALRKVWAAAEGGDVIGATGGFFGALGDVLSNAKSRFLEADKAGVAAFDSLKDGAAKARDELAKFGKTQAEVARIDVAARIAKLELGQASPETIASARAEGDAWIASAAALDAAKVATTSHADAQRDARDTTKQAAKDAADFVKSLTDQVATYGLAGAALERYRAAQQGLSPEQLSNAMAAIAQKEAMDALATESNEAATALESLRAMQSSLDDEIADMSAKLGGASAAQIAFNKTQRDAAKAYAIAAKGMDPRALDAYIKTMEKAKKKLDLSNEADSLAAIEDLMTRITEKSLSEKNPIFMMLDQVGALQEALEAVSDPMSKAFDPEKIKAFTEAVDAANAAIHVQMAGSFKALLGAVQTFTKEGSSSFDAIEKGMAAVAIVQDILAIKAAVVAVLTQGEGEPYSAWARMAAMAAAVAPLLASIGASLSAFGGGGGGPSSQSAEVRQASQGTGTVLGDPTAKSESIANAIEITADATSELVGLNRGMLNALLTLQDALGAAGGFLARGAGDVEFSRQAGDAGNWNWLSGGDSKVIDQGIIIAGGRLQDMLNGIVVGAYQTIETSGGWFHSDDTSDDVADVSDEFGKQFSLVMQSIADTVREGALALGLLPADIEAAMAAYQVEEIRISLKDLSAEEQQAELEAVFSSIFDGLAGAVVPFIEQFQKVGEGLGETLVRVATGVQVTQEAIRQLGLSVNETDPERFAQLSEGLIGAAGGIEAFITGMRGFVEAFAPESQQFAVASDALASAFDQVGLAVPETREGMWDLMQSLDATTEEGREQIATLLRLSGVAAEYYDLLDNQVAEATKYLQSIGLAGASLSNFGRELIEIRQSGARAEDAANLLAISHGREGASAIELAKIHDWTAKQIAAALRRLAQETKDLVSQLYGGQAGTLDGINEQISQLEGNLGGVSGGISAVADAGNELFESWMAGIQSLSEYLDSSLFGDLSPLNPEQQLTEAQSQLDAAIAAAAGGDADALADIPRLMDLYAGLLRDSEGSGGDYNGQILNYRAMLQDLLDMPGPEDLGEAGSSQNPIAVAVSASPELQALYEARDALLAQQEAEHRAVLAQQLAQNLHDLAVLTRTPILEMIELQGVALTDLAADMGVNLDNLTAGSVQALGNMATTLGIPLGELVQALGLNLPDLASGVRELATNLGIDLSALTAETARQLAGLGTSMGANLRELSTALGIDLGKLTDVDSPIFVALGQTIDTLSPDIKTELTPLLDAVKLAAGDEQKNAAVKALRDHVDAMAPDMKNLLAPYFDDIIPAASLDQLDYLEDLQDIGSKQLDVLKAIAGGLDVPGYAVGTGYVPQTGLAMIHEGEAIFPAPMANWMRSNGFPVVAGPAANDGALMRAVDVLREEVVALRRENADGHRATADATREEAGKASRQRDELSRRGEETQRSTRYG